MVVYTVSYPPRLIPVSLVLPSLDDQPANAPGPAPMAAPAAPSLNQVVKVLLQDSLAHHAHLLLSIHSVTSLYVLCVHASSTPVCMSVHPSRTWKRLLSSTHGSVSPEGICRLSSATQPGTCNPQLVIAHLGVASCVKVLICIWSGYSRRP